MTRWLPGARRASAAAWLVAAWLVAGGARATHAGAQVPAAGAESWSLDSAASVVRRIEGAADRVERLVSLGHETWHYGAGWVRIASSSEAVIGWSNPDGRLRVAVTPGADTTADRTLRLGSPLSDVLRLRGTPTSYLPDRLRGTLLLRYGPALVTLDARSRRVIALASPDDPPPGTPRAAASAGGAERAGARDGPRWPAALRAQVVLVTAGPAGRVEAEGDIALDVTVSNHGQGVARALQFRATGTGAPVRPVADWPRLDSLAAGATRVVRLTVHVGAVPRDTLLTLRIAIAEAQRFDLDPALEVRVPLRAAGAPRFEIADLAVEDPSGNGRIEPREVVDIVARVRNAGAGTAREVRSRVVPGPGVYLAPQSRAEQAASALPPGGSFDVRFTAFSDSRAAGFPVTLQLREARGHYDTTFVLPLALNRPVAPVAQVLRPADEPWAAAGEPPALVASVDTGIPRAPVRPGTLAVVLGVERYARAPDAVYAQRDALTFRRYAQHLLGTGDDAARLYFALNEDVSRSTMHKLFDADGWLARRTDASTDVVVFVAGHGTVDAKSRGAYLLPSDADPAYPAQTGLALDTLLERLGALRARSVTVFLDACFSGTTRDGAALVPWARDVGVSVEHPALRHANMVVLTASDANETAMGWAAPRHGLFTYWLLDGMRGAADANRDGQVNAGELAAHVTRGVRSTAASLGREQSPRLFTRDPRAVLVHLP